jgi:hypothetical protein
MENSLRLIQLVYNIIHKLSCLVLALTSIYPNYINHARSTVGLVLIARRIHSRPLLLHLLQHLYDQNVNLPSP